MADPPPEYDVEMLTKLRGDVAAAWPETPRKAIVLQAIEDMLREREETAARK